MRRFSDQEVERIRDLVARGWSCIGIARDLDRDALAVRHKVCALGLRTRPRKMSDVHDVRIGGDVLALLKAAAAQRGVTVQRLASLLLSAAALDGLVDAIVDDDRARHEKLARSKVYRENYRRRRRNGEPVLPPREAALLGFQTALTNVGLLPPELPAVTMTAPLPSFMDAPQLFARISFADDQHIAASGMARQGMKPAESLQ